MNDGSQEKIQVVATALEFFREAKYLSENHPTLASTIYAFDTVSALLLVLPDRIRRLGKNIAKGDPKANMKILENKLLEEQETALGEAAFASEIKKGLTRSRHRIHANVIPPS